MSVSNSLSGRHWELDQVPAVGDPTDIVQLGAGHHASANEGQRRVTLQRRVAAYLVVVGLEVGKCPFKITGGSVTSRRGTGMLLDVSCCLSMNCQRPRVERSGSKAAILPGA